MRCRQSVISSKRLFNFTESEINNNISLLLLFIHTSLHLFRDISLSSRLLSEGPRLSSSVVAQPPSGVPESTKQATASQPPPYTHHTYNHAPPAGGVMATPPQQSLYAATSTDYSSLQPHHQQQQQQPVGHQGALPPPHSQPSMMATLSSSPGSWSHNPPPMAIGQLPSISAYSANPLQQQRYVCGVVGCHPNALFMLIYITPCSQHFHATSISDGPAAKLQYCRGTPNGLHGNTGSSSTPLSTNFIVSATTDISSAAPALITNHHNY